MLTIESLPLAIDAIRNGGLSDRALKKLNGARLCWPDSETVDIQPIGLGTTSALNGSNCIP